MWGNKLGWLIALVFALAIVLQVTECSQTPVTTEQRQDIIQQQEVIDNIIQENQVMHAVNDQLRRNVVELSTNNSKLVAFARICTQWCPQMNGTSLPSPSPKVPIADILVGQDKVVVNIPDVQEGIIAASHSMEPLLGANDVVLERPPSSSLDVHVGDIIVYERDGTRIIHRVIETGMDAQGWYAIAKGDNNPRPDQDKIRFAEIRGVVIGVIY